MTDKQKLMLQKLAALGGLICLLIAFTVTNEYFFTLNNLMTIGLQTSTIAFIGIGVTCVILTGGIDLSIGSVVALAGVAAGMAVKAGVPIPLAFLLGIIVGGCCGCVNGLFVTRLRIPPFIATLGMMMIARGIALYVTNAAPVSGMPESFASLGNGALFRIVDVGANGLPVVKFPGIPYPVILMVILAIIFTFALTKLRVGRYLYAIGSNEEAARLSGINTDRIKLYAYIVSGMLAGLTGIVLASRLVTAQPNGGVMYELDAIASAVIGGTSLMGGVGTISGTMIGAFIMGVLRNGLNMNGVSFFVQQIIIGSVIVMTVAFDQYRQHQVKNKKSVPKKMPTKKEGDIMKKLAMVAMIGLTTVLSTPEVLAKNNEIAVIVKTSNSNFWQNVRGGAEAAKSELPNYTVTFQGPEAETQVAEQVNMVDNAINRGVAGIVLAPSDPDALVPTVKKAWEHGIPVVLIDSNLNSDGQYYQSFLATDNRSAGALAAQKLLDKLGGKPGKISMMSYTPGAGSAIERDGGFMDVVKKSGAEIKGPFYSQADMVTALNQTIDVLASTPDLTAIFGSNEPTAVGMARALKQQGYSGKVVAVGFDGNEDLQGFVRDGTLDGIVVQSSYQMGFKGVKSIDDILQGKKIEKFIDTGVVYVTKQNIDTAEAKAVLY
ncbi:substrate-binding domain-containing protein [Photobacterium sagamiensis]|uniref:substrate-binding domain-containing protein n=1 Tax=Photobacterium sagamiensis TaxID=2910241 RepID=UPI003D11056D